MKVKIIRKSGTKPAPKKYRAVKRIGTPKPTTDVRKGGGKP